jgi:hypothetical protein
LVVSVVPRLYDADVARPRHQKKDIEVVLARAEAHGWRIDSTVKKHWKAYCGCGKHLKTISLTPSDPNYPTNLLQWFKRNCWP